jgi:hypothetical protein
MRVIDPKMDEFSEPKTCVAERVLIHMLDKKQAGRREP